MLALTKYSSWFRRLALPLFLGIIFGSLSSLFVFHQASLQFAAEQGRAIQHFLASSSHGSEDKAAIPAIIHFVQLKKEPDAQLNFSFEHFLVLYAAYYHASPTAIYIHHDFSHEDIEHAKTHGSSWTRKVLTTFPCVRLNSVTAPTEANGYEVTLVEHKSDFVRLKALRQYGGLYMDWDVLLLRSLAPLRHAGYKTVVGRQFDRTINNGILLATTESAVIRIMDDETQKVFNGYWTTHSTTLLTRIANRLSAATGEVLIMDHKSFEPFSWEQPDVHALLGRHDGDAVPVPETTPMLGSAADPDANPADALWATLESSEGQKEWAYDYSDALFVHKMFNDVDTPPGFEGMNVDYILARDSNYALAAWPLVMEGIKQGIIDASDNSY